MLGKLLMVLILVYVLCLTKKEVNFDLHVMITQNLTFELFLDVTSSHFIVT